MNDKYQNAKIYSIRSHQTDKVYIGSTCSPLAKRLYEHRKKYERYKSEKYDYVTSFEILKFDDHYIELVEEYPCQNKFQLHRREGQTIREVDCVNKVIAGRTQVEYRHDNKDKIKEQKKQYYEENKDMINSLNNQYYEDNKDKFKQYREDNKDKFKQYREENRDKLNQKHTCQCGGKYNYSNKARHFKRNKHKEFEWFMSLTEEQVKAILKL